MKKILGAALGALAIGIGAASAQDYPTRPITMVIPFAAGGPTDTVGRLLAEAMGRELGQQVLVENVTGAGGTVGAARVASSAPDGYTLLLYHIGMATTATLYRNLPYDPRTAFSYIGLATEVPMTIIARPDFPANTLQELIDYVKANTATVTYANAGIGAASHLCGMLFMDAIDTQITTVPYQGTGPAMTDLLGGQVDFMCDQTTNTTSQIQAGAVKAYATTSPERLDALPDLPTATEGGLPALTFGVWHGLYAAAGTPEAIVTELSDALKVALEDPTVIERFAALATTPSAQEDATPAALEAKLESEIELWRPLIIAAGQFAD
jgi:tripartite-type tricarboxylate transporter receptor subunit TctC